MKGAHLCSNMPKSKLQLAWESMTDDQCRVMNTFDRGVKRSDARYRRLVAARVDDVGADILVYQPNDTDRMVPSGKKCTQETDDG